MSGIKGININNNENSLRSVVQEFPSLVKLINEEEFITPGYIKGNGSIASHDIYRTTNFINVKEYKALKVFPNDSPNKTNSVPVLEFDINYNILKYTNEFNIVNFEFDENTAYIRFSTSYFYNYNYSEFYLYSTRYRYYEDGDYKLKIFIADEDACYEDGNYYINTDGSKSYYDLYKTTKLIKNNNLIKFQYVLMIRIPNRVFSINLYNYNKEFLSANYVYLNLEENHNITDIDLSIYPGYSECYYVSFSVVGDFTNHETNVKLIINYPSFLCCLAEDEIEIQPDTSFYVNFDSYIRKPFTFNNKSAVFFGDSITYGVIYTQDGGLVTQLTYGKQFSDKVGLTFINEAESGSTLTKNNKGYSSIHTNIENSSTVADFVFIMGGINDWQVNIDLNEFKQGVKNLCDTLNSKYSQSIPIIWITPLNVMRSGFNVDVNDIIKYRYIMSKTIMSNDTYNRFSIILGSEMPFPYNTTDTELVTLLYGDLLHPSQIGHDIIAAYLMKLLA